MVVEEQKALKAIHRLLLQGRWLAGEGMSSPVSFHYFDELEGLMGYVINWQTAKSEAVETALKRVCLEA